MSDGAARTDLVFAFIDTNLLLEYQHFPQIDWRALLGARKVVLVMAPVVLAEVDRFKHAGSRRQKDRARAIGKVFDELELSHEPARVRDGVDVVAVPDEPGRPTFEEHHLQPDVPDDRLLAALVEFRGRLAAGAVVLVTDDTTLRVKARARGISIQRPDESLRLPDEPDETERQLATANRELAKFASAKPDLRVTLAGRSHGEFTVALVQPLPEDEIGRLLAAWRKRYPRADATPETLHGPMGLSVSLKQFGQAYGFGYLSKEDAEKRNKALDGLLSHYEEYLRSWHAVVNQRRCALRLAFTLENGGAVPADDVHVAFWTDTPGVWLERPHDRPRPPAPRKAKDPLAMLARHPFVPNVDFGDIRADPDMDGPEIVAGTPQSVRYWVRRVKHHLGCDLERVYFAFTTTKDVGSFTIHYRINAGNVREPVTGEIGIKVATPAHAETPRPPSPEPIDDDADDENPEDEI